jgi:hypothetical protein
MTTKRMGEEQFRWFHGVVEDIKDPQHLGRIKVRVTNEHDDPAIKTDDLTWATVIQSPTSAAHAGVGRSPTGILVGSHVFGFFMDSHEKQLALVWGTFAKIPDGTQATNDVPILARGTNSVKHDKFGPEPEPAYAAQYPYNHVTVTQSGHVIEVDDTPAHERIRIFHKSGTYTEINKDGQSVSKVVDNAFHVVVKNQVVHIGGATTVIITGDCKMMANAISMVSQSDITMYAPGGLHVMGSGINTSGALSSDLCPSGTFSTPTGDQIYVDGGVVTGISKG